MLVLHGTCTRSDHRCAVICSGSMCGKSGHGLDPAHEVNDGACMPGTGIALYAVQVAVAVAARHEVEADLAGPQRVPAGVLGPPQYLCHMGRGQSGNHDAQHNNGGINGHSHASVGDRLAAQERTWGEPMWA